MYTAAATGATAAIAIAAAAWCRCTVPHLGVRALNIVPS